MKKQRATDIEKSNRIFTIQGWLFDGVSDRLIVRQIIANWGISLRQAERYVKEAYTSNAKIEGITLENKRQMKISEYQHRKRTLDSKFRNTPEGIRVLNEIDKMIDKLEGIERPKQLEVQTVVKPIEFTIIRKTKE
jgi:hypothetical protein